MLHNLAVLEPEHIGYRIRVSTGLRDEFGMQEHKIAFGRDPQNLPLSLRELCNELFQILDYGSACSVWNVRFVFYHSRQRELFERIAWPVPNQTHTIEGKYHFTIDWRRSGALAWHTDFWL